MKLLYTVEEAAEATGLSTTAIKYAITQKVTREKQVMRRLPRLRAKQATGNAYRITHTDLAAWVEALPDYE